MGKVIRILVILTALLIGLIIVYESVKTTIRQQSDTQETQLMENIQQWVEMDERKETNKQMDEQGSQPSRTRIAKASWYGQAICKGREVCKTASGELFREEENTFAHRTMPFGTRVEFCYNDTCIIAKCSDRGPFIDGRDFDFSYGLFNRLSNPNKGVIDVEWKKI